MLHVGNENGDALKGSEDIGRAVELLDNRWLLQDFEGLDIRKVLPSVVTNFCSIPKAKEMSSILRGTGWKAFCKVPCLVE